jgi:hypothetical protein
VQHEQHEDIAALLRQAGAAHGEYETHELNGVYDQHWPDWYASYLVQHGLGDLLGGAVTIEQLSSMLKAYDVGYQRERPPLAWPEYYAQQLIAQLRSPS